MLIDRENNFHRQTFFFTISMINFQSLSFVISVSDRTASLSNATCRIWTFPLVWKKKQLAVKFCVQFWWVTIFGLYRYIRWSTLIVLLKLCSSSIAIVKESISWPYRVPYQRSKNHNRTRRIAYLIFTISCDMLIVVFLVLYRSQDSGNLELSNTSLLRVKHKTCVLKLSWIFFSEIKDVVLFLAIPRLFHTGVWSSMKYNPVATQRTIKFEVEKINIGGGYDSNTGVFTSPSDGYYVFHWSVTSTNSTYHCPSAIMKNGVEVIGNEVGGNLATFHMNRNDRAWIKATTDCTLLYNHSSFSGFKLI